MTRIDIPKGEEKPVYDVVRLIRYLRGYIEQVENTVPDDMKYLLHSDEMRPVICHVDLTGIMKEVRVKNFVPNDEPKPENFRGAEGLVYGEVIYLKEDGEE